MNFPLHPDKHQSPSLLTAEAYLGYKQEYGSVITKLKGTAVLCWAGGLTKAWAERRGLKIQKTLGFSYCNYNGLNIVWGVGIGAPAAAIAVEELAALGINRILGLGIAGAIDGKLQPGDVVLCESSYRDEGTSYHYLPPEKSAHANEPWLSVVHESLRAGRIESEVGASWTTDSPYRETAQEVAHFASLGVKTVEMEASAIYAVAMNKGLPAATVFVISDLVSAEGWKPQFHHKQVAAKLRQILSVLAEKLPR